MKQEIISYLSTISNDIMDLSNYLHDNPEYSFKEYKSVAAILKLLKNHSFKIEENFLNIETAFLAQYGEGHPKICYICEYDAPEGLAHITGHNLISSMSVGAAIGLSKVLDKVKTGSVIVLGCPGEFMNSSKITMTKQGVFEDIDVVLMAHPDIITSESGTSKAILPIGLKFNGSDSLDKCLLSMHKIVTSCTGDCSIDNIQIDSKVNFYDNISTCKFFIRADDLDKCNTFENSIKNLIKEGSNSKCEFFYPELPYCELHSNKTLNRIFSHNLKEVGIIDIGPSRDINSGLSLGIVSKKVPCIHPYIRISKNEDLKYGTPEFANETITLYAHDIVMKTASALAITGLDLIQKESLLNEVRESFSNSLSSEP